MAQRIRWGILGTGDINRKLLRGARLSSEVEVVAVGSRDPERAAAFATEHGIPRSFGSYEALLGDPGRRCGLHLPTELAPPPAGR